jgi:hypothetical protein
MTKININQVPCAARTGLIYVVSCCWFASLVWKNVCFGAEVSPSAVLASALKPSLSTSLQIPHKDRHFP